jgi:hypothetical protein
LASRVIPRYLAVLAYGNVVPLMKIGCCLIFLFVKSICSHSYTKSEGHITADEYSLEKGKEIKLCLIESVEAY